MVDVNGVEDRVDRIAALVLGAHALAERAEAPCRDDGAAQRLAALQWAVRAGAAEIQRIAEDGPARSAPPLEPSGGRSTQERDGASGSWRTSARGRGRPTADRAAAAGGARTGVTDDQDEGHDSGERVVHAPSALDRP